MAGTVIGEGLTIEGEFSSEDEVVVHGTVRGTLSTTGNVSIGSGGVIEADVRADSIGIAGQVTGDVHANQRVDIQAGGRLIGDVKASRLTIADGASFKGNVDMDV
jgi:cytoskeletal protein CcmA (bactofilin family)